MRRMARWMIRLYPASWRARYGEEIEALLSDTGADARVIGDLARGGMRMQLKAWPFPLLALALGAAGLLTGLAVSFLVPNVYVSEAVLRIDSGHLTTDRLDMRYAEDEVESRTNLSRIIMTTGLYRSDLKVEPLEDVIDEMRRHIGIDPIASDGRGAAFRIRFDYGDKTKARQTAAALVDSFQKYIPDLPRHNAQYAGERMIVLDNASLLAEPVWPTKTVLLGGGFLAGVLIAGILRAVLRAGWLRRWFVPFAAVAAITGMVVAIYGADLRHWGNEYRSTARFVLRSPQSYRVTPLVAEMLSPESLSTIANDPRLRLYQWEMDEQPLEDVLRRMREHIAVTYQPWGDGDGTEIGLTFDYPDAVKARQTMQIFIAKFEELADRRLERPVDTAVSAPWIEVLDRASAPQSPASPNRMLAATTGAGCGVFLAGVISLLRRRWKAERQIPADSISA